LRDRLRKAGYTVSLRDVKTGNTHTWRVLAGPLNERGKAEQLRDRLSREQHLKGIVIQHPG
jgi:cell division septation protein DedD